jgi:hypothetical protein
MNKGGQHPTIRWLLTLKLSQSSRLYPPAESDSQGSMGLMLATGVCLPLGNGFAQATRPNSAVRARPQGPG